MPEQPVDVAAAFAELQDLIMGTHAVHGFLQELSEQAARQIRHGLSCGITLQSDGWPSTVASSDAYATQVDELQYGLNLGPCLRALDTGEEVLVDDMAADDRWHDYAVHALAHQVRSSLSVPLIVADRSIGALNLYSRDAGAFGEAERHDARQFALTASGALAIARRLGEQAMLTEQLCTALAHRSTIDHALGIIMAQQECTADAAFATLRSAAQNRNVELHHVAAEIVSAINESPR